MELKDGIKKRLEVASTYYKKMGWSENLEELSFEQVLEIRGLNEWKNAFNNKETEPCIIKHYPIKSPE